MARWIAFDQKTSSLLRSSLAQGATVETFGRGAIDYALAKPGAVVTLLPAAGGLDVGIAVFRRPQKRAVTAPVSAAKPMPLPVPPKPAAKVASTLPPRSATTRAGGFLGLSDELFEEDTPVEQKKGWWRKFWDD
ncbi:MAG TPA: hypothetical protein VIB39_16575 [Candidatus Angelobacter sp.]|jgi:hypothetical protein